MRPLRAALALAVLLSLCSAAADAATGHKRKSASKVAKVKPPREPWLLFPVDVKSFQRVSSSFGFRKLHRTWKQHRGVDLVAPRGAWVVAAREGRVTSIGKDKLCGFYVRLEHANGWRTVYCHLKRDPRAIGLVEGADVAAQSVLGEVGSTGHSTGPHLHFSLVDPAGKSCDPLASLYTPRETYDLLRQWAKR